MTDIELTNKIGAFTKRFNEDFFQAAKSQIILHERSRHVYPKLTKVYRDLVQTNGVLERYEKRLMPGSLM